MGFLAVAPSLGGAERLSPSQEKDHMKYMSSRAARSAATAIALTAAAGAVSVCYSAHAQSQPPAVQWRVQDGGNGHWYQLRVESRTWEEHRAMASSSGAHLATVTSPAEGAFVSANLPGRAWLGGVAPANQGCDIGAWQWITGEPWSYSNWAPPEPNYCDETYLELSGVFPGKWNNYYPWIPGRALVEWSADCNGDGVVDYGQIASGQLPDVNSNGVPDQCECLGDVTANGNVDGVDLAALLSAWGTNGQGQFMTDIDGDGIVGGTDLAYVLSGWGPCPE